MLNIRTSNVGLASYMAGGRNNLAKKLAGLTNRCYLSEMANGQRQTFSGDLRSFERRLNLPPEWFERDNESLLKLSSHEFSLMTKVLALPEQKQEALMALLAESEEKLI